VNAQRVLVARLIGHAQHPGGLVDDTTCGQQNTNALSGECARCFGAVLSTTTTASG
jgi:hypothetical protein